ncbi:type II secretion system F family protein [Staphylococcus pasteuri]|uniref:type II secretion system F family protein n=1 Tax=Staphylococcus pasteuri TaxID=45972 RepID=UPI002DBD5822|nr:type II secretion system F family protein [Staphylococcus pasteuri]MEB6611431.1 type II secretion system F family protein [Staphylococcus pasteuri]
MKLLLINIFKFRQAKCLTKSEQLDLVYRLHQLLKHGFTLYESFKFLNLHFKYRGDKSHDEVLNKIEQGATCWEVFKYLDYSSDIVTQTYLAERFGNLELSPLQSILSYFITTFPLFIIILSSVICILSIIFKYRFNKMTIENQIQLMCHIPIIKHYYKILKTYQLSNEFAHFYRNGVNLQIIVRIYKQSENNQFHQFLGDRLLNQSYQGENLPDILKKLNCYENDLIKFIEQGEKSGKLDIELTLYSQILIQQFEAMAKRHIKFIQPVIFLILGLFIVALYLTIMLPIFDMLQSIK